MAGGKEQALVRFGDGLGAVAMMDIEIHDRHAVKLVHRLRMARGHRHGIEQAEAHGAAWLGVMTGRPHGAEGVAGLARRHRIHRRGHGAGRSQRCHSRTGRENGVWIKRAPAGFGHGAQNVFDEGRAMDARQGRFLCQGRVPAGEAAEFGLCKRLQHRRKARRRIRDGPRRSGGRRNRDG